MATFKEMYVNIPYMEHLDISMTSFKWFTHPFGGDVRISGLAIGTVSRVWSSRVGCFVLSESEESWVHSNGSTETGETLMDCWTTIIIKFTVT